MRVAKTDKTVESVLTIPPHLLNAFRTHTLHRLLHVVVAFETIGKPSYFPSGQASVRDISYLPFSSTFTSTSFPSVSFGLQMA